MIASITSSLLAAALQIGVEALSLDASFVSQGGDSITALRFSAECRRHGIVAPLDIVLSDVPISQVLQQCHQRKRPARAAPGLTPNNLVTNTAAQSNKRMRIRNIEDLSDGSFREHAKKSRPSRIPSNAPLSPPEEDLIVPLVGHYRGLDLVAVETENLYNLEDVVHEMSETQVSFLHGSIESSQANIIYYGETHHPDYLPNLKVAWKQVCRTEPIFCTTYRNPGDGQPIRPQLFWRELRTSSRTAYEDACSAGGVPDLPWPMGSVEGGSVDFGAVCFTEIRYEAPSSAESRTTLIWAVHHARVDGWSAELLVKKVHMAAAGQVVRPGPSFTDVCVAYEQLRLHCRAEADYFWAQQREKVAAACDELLLESPSHDDTILDPDSNRGQGHFVIKLSADEQDSLRATAQLCSVTTATLFYTAWAVCLGLYTDSDNVVLGTVVSARNASITGIFDTIGPAINMLPLQIDLDWEIPVQELVRDVFGRMQRLAKYSWTTPENGFARVRGNMMALTPDVQKWSDGHDIRCNIGPSFFRHATNLPLSVVVQEDGSNVTLQYDRQRYTCQAMESLARIFTASLLSLCQIDASLGSAHLVLKHCGEKLTSFGNWHSEATHSSSIKDDLVTLFERGVSTWPRLPAIQYGQAFEMSYAQLEARSGQIAQTLIGLIKPGEVVAVHADGSANWIASIFGILRAGGVYCALDQAHPQNYRDGIFQSSTARVFLATSSDATSTKPATAITTLCVDTLLKDCSFAPLAFRTHPRPKDQAYLCFTSGSTGKPKGVMCTHEGLVAFQSNLEVRLFASPGIKIAQTMSVAFDGAIHELFSALSYGATLVLHQAGDSAGLSHLKAADSAILTPSLASALDPEDFPRLKTVYLVGEAVPQTVCDTWAMSKALYNMYGPTEATCGATIKRLYPWQPVTIGGPNPTTRIYILDHHQRVAPPGRVGEIYLAGVQVAQGYIGRPEVTAERFLPDPICELGQEFMYRTGDRGYWSESGEVIFCGRADRQIKLCGFRIDLEDLEARILRACSEVTSAVAVTHTGDDLVCMVQSTSTDISAIKTAIRKEIPAYAVPRYISVTSRLPMTRNLKVDYRAVAVRAIDAQAVREYQQHGKSRHLDVLATDTEMLLANIWGEVLDHPDVTTAPIGPSSNFTQLGGHSLQQLRLAARLKAVFGSRITMRMISEMATLRDLAAMIDTINADTKKNYPSPSPSGSGSEELGNSSSNISYFIDTLEPSSMETEWFYKTQVDCNTPAFNVSWVARLDGQKVCLSRLLEAWNTVLKRHILFRSRYVKGEGPGGPRRVLSEAAPSVDRRDTISVREEVNRPFDLSTEPPVRVMMCDQNIVAVWSHIVCDYTTLNLVLGEVAAVYRGDILPLPTVPCYQRLRQIDPQCLDFWTRCLGPVKHRRPSYLSNGAQRTSYTGQSLVGRISTSIWHRMQDQAKQSRVTMQQLLVAACAVSLSALDNELDITLGTPFINRHSEEDMKAVGLFLEPLPVRIHGHAEASSLDLYLAGVQSSAQQALSHAVPWNQLLEHLHIDARAKMPNHQLFDCVASFHDHRDAEAGPWRSGASGPGIEPQFVWSDGAKFQLMVECLAYDNDTLLMRLEYDGTCYNGHSIRMVQRMILRAIEALSTRGDCALSDLRRKLQLHWNSEKEPILEESSQAAKPILQEVDEDLFLRCFSDMN